MTKAIELKKLDQAALQTVAGGGCGYGGHGGHGGGGNNNGNASAGGLINIGSGNRS